MAYTASFYAVLGVIIKATTYAVVKKLLLCHDSQAPVIQNLTPVHAEKRKGFNCLKLILVVVVLTT